MKAAIRRKYGTPKEIIVEQTTAPVPKENQVLIKVFATTVNRTDCANLTAKPFIMRFVLGLFRPRKIILGTDFAGEIMELGSQVKAFNKGDRVFGFNDIGSESQAEFITRNIDDVYLIPTNINYKQAAASLEGAHYAYSFIHKVTIQPGQSILINGATGGIGSALLQFAMQHEVKITATCNTKNVELIKSLGAHKIIDYTKEDFTRDNDTYDFVFDAVGKSTFGKCKSLLKTKGVYISSEPGPYAQNVFYPLLNFVSKRKVIFPIPYKSKRTIPYISNLIETNKFKPVIDREYAIDDISEAYSFVLTGQKTGNVVINLTEGSSN